MSARFLLAALLLLAAPACTRTQAAPSAPQPHFPVLTGRVVDQAGLLTSAQDQALSDESAAIERDTKAQYVIVTVRSLEGLSIADYGRRLGNFWGIGRKGVDDGVVLLVAPAERQVRIAVGYGLEKRITDAFAAKVIQRQLVPAFRAGRFADGIRAGSDALDERLRSKASDAEIEKEDQLTI